MERDVWDVITGDEKKPVWVESSDKSSKIDESAFQINLKQFKKKASIALSVIYNNIEIGHRKIIEKFEDPKLMWDELEKYYYPDTRSFEMQTFSQLVECRIAPGETIKLFSARLARIGDRLRSTDKKFSERYISYQLLRYLPPQFDSIVQGILRWESEKFNFKNVTLELVAEELRLKFRNEDQMGKAQSFYTTSIQPLQCSKCNRYSQSCNSNDRVSRIKSRSSRGRTSGVLSCRGNLSSPGRNFSEGMPSSSCRSPVRGYCPFPGESTSGPHRSPVRGYCPFPGESTSGPHRSPVRGYCPLPGKSTSNPHRSPVRRGRDRYRCQKGVKYRQPSSSPGDRKSVYSFYLATANFSESESTDAWVFDTAASHHFCGRREYFASFTPLVNERMTVAINNITFPIEGKGSVPVKFGNRKIVLNDVMYSSALKRN